VKTIRALRRERGWTQFELALKVGVQPQAVYFWESGRRTPQVPQLRKLGETFGMCSDDIDLNPSRAETRLAEVEQSTAEPRVGDNHHPRGISSTNGGL
jgi:DNA-binding XRE family transcriptional regulator